MGQEIAGRLAALYDAERARLLRCAADPGSPAGAYEAPVFGEGSLAPALALIGEAPGAEETALGRPFVGRAGKHLSALLEAAGLAREEVYITNTVKYRPVAPGARGLRNRTPGPEEVRAGLPLLRAELLLLRPRVVATLGNVPLRALLLLAGMPCCTVGEAHGRLLPLRLAELSAGLYPMYHPASTMYNPALAPVCRADAVRLGEIAVNKR